MSKNNTKGFTLIEIIITLVIVVTITTVAVGSYIGISSQKKKEEWKLVQEQIETAAEQYFTANEYLFEGLTNDAIGEISVGKLVEEDYLNKVTDPRSGKSVDYCTIVNVTKNGKKLDAKYSGKVSEKDNNGSCKKGIYTVMVSEAGAPSGKLDFKKTDENNAAIEKTAEVASTGWFNVESLKVDKKNDGKGRRLGTCIKANTNGNGPIVSATIGENKGKEYTFDNKKYYCYSYSDGSYNNMQLTLENSSGKKWKMITSFKVDSTPPAITNFSISSEYKGVETYVNDYYDYYVNSLKNLTPKSIGDGNYKSITDIYKWDGLLKCGFSSENKNSNSKYDTSQNYDCKNITLDRKVYQSYNPPDNVNDNYYLPSDSSVKSLINELVNDWLEHGYQYIVHNTNFIIAYYVDPSDTEGDYEQYKKIYTSSKKNGSSNEWKYYRDTICKFKEERKNHKTEYTKQQCIKIDSSKTLYYENLDLDPTVKTQIDGKSILTIAKNYDKSIDTDKYLYHVINYTPYSDRPMNSILAKLDITAKDETSKISDYTINGKDDTLLYFENITPINLAEEGSIKKDTSKFLKYIYDNYTTLFPSKQNSLLNDFRSKYSSYSSKKELKKHNLTTNLSFDYEVNNKTFYNKDSISHITSNYQTNHISKKSIDAESDTISFSQEKVLIPGAYDGSTVTISLSIKDKAGNETLTTQDYTKYNECTYTEKATGNSPAYECISNTPCTTTDYGYKSNLRKIYLDEFSYDRDIYTKRSCSGPTFTGNRTDSGISYPDLTCGATYCPPTNRTCPASSSVTNVCGNDGVKTVHHKNTDCTEWDERVDCGISSISLDIDDTMKRKPGPASSTGKGPIFKDQEGTGAYSCSAKRGMNVSLSCSDNRAYAAASCMYVSSYDRSFDYVVTWDDGSKADARSVTLPAASSNVIDNKFKDRKNPISFLLYRDKLVSRFGCDNNGNIKVASCGSNSGTHASVTTHVYYISVGEKKSNSVTLYTKYFAVCGY